MTEDRNGWLPTTTIGIMPSLSLMADDFPNGRLALQPDTENVSGGVDIAIVRRPAFRAIPMPHSKPCDTSRPRRGQAAARRTGLGTPSLVNVHIYGLPSGSLIPQHVAERRPSGIQDRLRHLGFRQFGGAHIADNDQTILPSYLGRLLVKVVTARVGNLRVDCAHPFLVPTALGAAQGIGILSVVLECGNLAAIAESGEVFQAEVDPNLPISSRKIVRNLALKGDVPATASIFDEGASSELADNSAVCPKAVVPPQIGHHSIAVPRRARQDRHPPQRAAATETCSKSWRPFRGVPGVYKLPANLIDGIRMETEQGTGSAGHLGKRDSGRPPLGFVAAATTLDLDLGFHTIIPDLVRSGSEPAQMAARGGVLDPELIGDKRHPFFCHNRREHTRNIAPNRIERP